MVEVVNDPQSDPSTEAPDPSRAVTRPYVFDPAVEVAKWVEWKAGSEAYALTNAPDEAEAKRIVELHKMLAAVSLPAVKP